MASNAFAIQVQPVPIPEDMATMPQIEIDGVGLGTIGYGNAVQNGRSGYQGDIDFSDSSLLVGAAQRLYEAGGLGSMGFGVLAPDTANSGNGAPILINQAFLDYQTDRMEWLVGRSDNPASHLVDFPTIREEDFLVFTNPLDPFSNGASLEDNRYSNSVSFTLNQDLEYFENIHAQQLFDNRAVGANPGIINSYGATLEYVTSPGMEALSRVVSYGLGFERQDSISPRGLNQFYGGGVVNILEGLTDRVDFRVLDLVNWGTDLTQFQSITDTFQASYNTTAANIRYLHSPFGRPAYQLALTGAYENYFNVNQARTWALAVTGVRRLGAGFDLVLQYQTQWRDTALAAQYAGQTTENVIQAGFIFNFNSTFNQHLSPRRSLLNTQHQYIPD